MTDERATFSLAEAEGEVATVANSRALSVCPPDIVQGTERVFMTHFREIGGVARPKLRVPLSDGIMKNQLSSSRNAAVLLRMLCA